ncbi:MAG: hypothetical protein A2W99_11960 [Bacteroidetes bacterium GWF2_33_16]|nr:MAG: hypothetical protein A2X00_02315 [Bacteroidetes bacterium GWE2_32_14]OFY06414.1 MAG: hypothetical protein A2W99_11960 [Bacteroidetes bacterium GWF2_33_16]
MVFNLFKKKKKKVQLKDLNGNPLQVGDKVESLRYDLGISTLIETENGFEYESEATGQKVSYARMIDAATTFQKVRKIF